MPYALAIHGGAGDLSGMAQDAQDEYHACFRAVLAVGEALLANGASALDAVETCVRMLEDDPHFNAGRGSVLTAEGTVEMDASIMDGSDLRAGAVAGIHNVRNPIALARLVMERTPHVFLIGEGAQRFATSVDAPMEPDAYFITEKRLGQLEQAQREGKVVVDHDGKKYGTVGAVARDRTGHLAAATSTGGITNKRFGRVGDSPVIGAGCYADDASCAVSATGYGEQFLRVALAKTVADLIEIGGRDVRTATDEAIAMLVRKVRGLGGIITVGRDGAPANAFSSGGMLRAWVEEGSEPASAIL